jgi:hypothetical protein
MQKKIFNHIGFNIERTMDLNEREKHKHSKYENILATFDSCCQRVILMLLVWVRSFSHTMNEVARSIPLFTPMENPIETPMHTTMPIVINTSMCTIQIIYCKLSTWQKKQCNVDWIMNQNLKQNIDIMTNFELMNWFQTMIEIQMILSSWIHFELGY